MLTTAINKIISKENKKKKGKNKQSQEVECWKEDSDLEMWGREEGQIKNNMKSRSMGITMNSYSK